MGKGILVGKPLVKLAKDAGAKVISCDKDTKNLGKITKNADILVSGVGKKSIIKEDMVSEESTVIDAGTQVISGSQVGDVDFENLKDKVQSISPPKAGVGPVTIAQLVKNLVISAKNRKKS